MTQSNIRFSEPTRLAILQSMKVVAVIAMFFTTVVGVLLSVNYVRLKNSDPMGRELMDSLVLQLQDDPGNETLKTEIRQLDLLARKAYFSAQWQSKTGTALFIGGTVVLMVSIFLINRLSGKPKLPDPQGQRNAEENWSVQMQLRSILGVCAVLILVFGALGVWLPFTRYFPLETGNPDAIDEAESLPDAITVEAEPVDPLTIWPSFRGPGGDGIANTDQAPTHWDFETGQGIRWTVQVPKSGFNSPVVWGDKIFLSGADENAQEIYCYDRRDGRLLWTHTVGSVPGSAVLEDPYYETGRAASSLSVDGRYVCAIFANGNVVCTDLEGNKVWAVALGLPENHYGHSSSLIIHEGLVFVQWDQSENPRLIAYHLKDGSVAWQVERYALSWSSPICVDTGTRNELILTDSQSVTSYEPETGRLNWRSENVSGGEMGPSAFYRNGMVFAGTDIAQFVALRLHPEAEPEVLWTFDEHLPDTSSVVGTDDYLFMATGYSVLACIDVKEGTLVWEHDTGDGFYSSPVLVGDLVYLWDLSGTAYIFRATDEFQAIAEIPSPERIVTTPAFVGDNIILRGETNLYCIGNFDRAEEGLE